MKPLLHVLFLIALFLLFPSFRQGDTYQIDLNRSVMSWRMPVANGDHYGTIRIKSGYLVYDAGIVTGGTFIIDLNTVKDIDLEEKKRPLIEAHIRSADFLETAAYPYATFVIDRTVTEPGKGLMAYGKLTIKNITHPVSFPLSLKKFDDAIYVVADKVEVSRKDYGMGIKDKSFMGRMKEMAIDKAFSVGFTVVLHP